MTKDYRKMLDEKYTKDMMRIEKDAMNIPWKSYIKATFLTVVIICSIFIFDYAVLVRYGTHAFPPGFWLTNLHIWFVLMITTYVIVLEFEHRILEGKRFDLLRRYGKLRG